MLLVELNYPLGNIDLDFAYRKLKKKLRENHLYLVFAQIHTAYRQYRHLMLFGKPLGELNGLTLLRMCGVEQHDERLLNLL